MQKRSTHSTTRKVIQLQTRQTPTIEPEPLESDTPEAVQALCSDELQTLGDLDLIRLILQESRDATSQVSARLYANFMTLRAMEHAGMTELIEIQGMDLCKAAALQAAFVLGRRLATKALYRGQSFVSSREIFLAYASRLAAYEQETFWILLLDQRNRILKHQQIAQGSINRCPLTPLEIFTPAIREKANQIVLLHNHPSGDPEPSSEDRHLTENIQKAGLLLGVKLLDHLVIGDQCYVSFADRGWL